MGFAIQAGGQADRQAQERRIETKTKVKVRAIKVGHSAVELHAGREEKTTPEVLSNYEISVFLSSFLPFLSSLFRFPKSRWEIELNARVCQPVRPGFALLRLNFGQLSSPLPALGSATDQISSHP